MTTFDEILNSPLYGIMRWEKWDEMCDQIQNGNDPWFVYSIGHEVPQQAIQDESLKIALDEIRALLRREHEEDYLGIVYVDDLSTPRLIKIYDPNNLGSTCGSSGRYIPPGWILSTLPPSPVASDIPTQ
jgi:hypothetical protein